jgi:hypothetical protein
MNKIALLCYCRKGEFCHRDLVAELIKARAQKMGKEVEIIGAQMSEMNRLALAGYRCLNITVKAKVPVSPTWDIVMPIVNARKSGTETLEMQETYKYEYGKLLNSRKQAVYAWIDKLLDV